MTTRRTTRRHLAAGGLVLALLAAACGSDNTTVADGSGGEVDEPSDQVDDVGVDLLGFTAAEDEPLAGPLYLLPVDLDMPHEIDNARVLSAAEVDVGTSGSALLLGVPTEAGARDLVLVGLEDVETDREVSESEQRTLTLVDVNGIEARMSESLLGATVDWFADGRSAGVFAAPGAEDLALAVARALDPMADGVDAIREVPDGLTILASAEVTPETATDIRPALARWSATLVLGARRLSFEAEAAPVDFVPMVVAAIGAEELRTIEVRGARGAWSTRTSEHEGTDDVGILTTRTTTLTWLERPGFAVTIRGDADIEALVTIADSLVEVTRDEFEEYTRDL